jgi:hypothetical protein
MIASLQEFDSVTLAWKAGGVVAEMGNVSILKGDWPQSAIQFAAALPQSAVVRWIALAMII